MLLSTSDCLASFKLNPMYQMKGQYYQDKHDTTITVNICYYCSNIHM